MYPVEFGARETHERGRPLDEYVAIVDVHGKLPVFVLARDSERFEVEKKLMGGQYIHEQ